MLHHVGILIFDGFTLLDASGPADVFHHADPIGDYYAVSYISSSGGAVRASSGVTLADTVPVAQVTSLDTLLVTGGTSLVTRDQDPTLLLAVDSLAQVSQRVASVCTGAFLLAALGYLNDRRATTHWRHSQKLTQWYPRIRVEPDVIHTRDGRYLTSAGVTAGIDLALAMVEHDVGVHTAREVARELVMFLQRPGGQSQFSSALGGQPAADDQLRTLMDAVIANPASNHSVSSMAEQLGVSTRHLNRIFHAEIGRSPARWLEEVRIDAARGLLLEGHPITKVAELSGLGTDETLRRAFAKHLGTTPTAFRRRFSSTSA